MDCPELALELAAFFLALPDQPTEESDLAEADVLEAHHLE
jgi:hypothetical protein